MNPAPAALDLAGEICSRYRIADLESFLESCRSFAAGELLNVAVLGRFKAGKSSFLNHLLQADLLPSGVTPVTSVITTIEFGASESAEVRYLDGRIQAIAIGDIDDYVAEAANPGNTRQVASLRIALPAMEPYRDIRFVDTPGLHSVFAHNTAASTEWLPNTGMALVAVGVDPPLAQHDIELIRALHGFTPHISVLLTKVDTLAPSECTEVENFVRQQLAQCGDGAVRVFPYSVRPGFEHLRERLARDLLLPACNGSATGRAAILQHKIDSLLGQCRGYLTVALRAAEAADADRQNLRQAILGQKQSLADTRLALKLIVRHAAVSARGEFENMLLPEEQPVRDRLLAAFAQEFPTWPRSLSRLMDRFDQWLGGELTREMAALSSRHRGEFASPVARVRVQLSRALQDFRNRLAEATLAAVGVALQTTQIDLPILDPHSPDIRVGRIFDRNWELLSPIVPMRLFRETIKRHFRRKIADAVFTNLSRLASQWDETVQTALTALESSAYQSLDTLIATVERLLAATTHEAPAIRRDLDRLHAA